MTTQSQIADKLGLHISTVSRILNHTDGCRASGETVQKVFRTARDMGYDFSRAKKRHMRNSVRVNINSDARLRWCSQSLLIEMGGIAKNICEGGVWVENFNPEPSFIPLAGKLELKLSIGSWNSEWIDCDIVRTRNTGTGIGICLKLSRHSGLIARQVLERHWFCANGQPDG